uniref:Innexin n=1 Tax=Rhabditophanes sp. KR3021 TaxID=114890 RepID=A0AC35U7P3_9BILA
MFLFRVMHAVPYTNRDAVKDVIANLHSYFTCNLLIGIAVLISYRQFSGRPIECMLPMGFTGAWEDYVENYCFSEDNYFVPTKTAIETYVTDPSKKRKISYYQYISFFILFQAACFKAPAFIWKYFASQSGMRVGEILRLATDPQNSNPEIRKANVHSLSTHLQGALRFHKRLKLKKLVPHRYFRFLNLKYSGYYVTFIYFFAKLGFLINNIIQLKLLQTYLIPESTQAFGYDAIVKLLTSNSTWEESGVFPRVSLCDFEVREMGQRQMHTVQCILVINLLTEKIFITLWLWFSILFVLTVCNFASWVLILFSSVSKCHFILNSLIMGDEKRDIKNDLFSKRVHKFISHYMGLDGIFVLRMIYQHVDVVLSVDLICTLWEAFVSIEERREQMKKVDKEWNTAMSKLSKIEQVEQNNILYSKDAVQNSPRLRRKTIQQQKTISDDKLHLRRALSNEYLVQDKNEDSDDSYTRKSSITTDVLSSRKSSVRYGIPKKEKPRQTE